MNHSSPWQNVEFMSHPLYSPDLAPNDFSLFPHIKKKMHDQRFSSPEDTLEVFKNHVLEVYQPVWRNKHKLWSYIKTFWVPLCQKLSNFPMIISDLTWQQQKYARPDIYVVTYVFIMRWVERWHYESVFNSWILIFLKSQTRFCV